MQKSPKNNTNNKPKKVQGIFWIFLLFVIGAGASPPILSPGHPETNTQTTKVIPIVSSKPISTGSLCIKHPDISFFMYHYIRDDDKKDTEITRNLSVPPGVFREHMKYVHDLAASGSITLMRGDDFLASLKSGCFPGNPIWIFTSDDGWKDTYTDLVPIARESSVPFFLGIIVNRIGKDGFVSTGEVQEIAKNPLFTISSHSMNHNDESKMSATSEHFEMCESKKRLEEILGKPVDTYIYPSGKMNTDAIMDNLRDCGYNLAWTTSRGKNWNWEDLNLDELNRIRISHDTPVSFFREILHRTSEFQSGSVLKNIN